MENKNEAVKEEEIVQDEDRQNIENEEKSEDIETKFDLESEVEEQDKEEDEVEESLEERLKKTEEEKENLKKALQKERKKKKEAEPKEDVRAIVEDVVTTSEKKKNEVTARNEFLKEFPEYNKTSNWNMLRDNFSSRGGSSKEEILQDFRRADALVRLDKGELTPEYQESYMQNRAQARMSDLSTVSSTSSSKSYSPPEFSNEEMDIMKTYGISEEGMRKYKEAKTNGQIL